MYLVALKQKQRIVIILVGFRDGRQKSLKFSRSVYLYSMPFLEKLGL